MIRLSGMLRDAAQSAGLATLGVALGLLLVVLALRAVGGERERRWRRAFDRACRRLACRRVLGIGVAALVGLSAGVTWVAGAGVPVPRVHDEFSYLLAGDTFARGRLANAPVPYILRGFVDTPHVIQTPSYAAKYPPGQGLALALGQVVFGYPIVGVWLSVALACGAAAWALYQALPPRWAFLGGLLTALHPMVWRWASSYWGGGVSLLGGALLLGGLCAALKRRRLWGGLVAGAGVGVLAVSRPYEGMALVLALGFWPVLAAIRGKLAWRRVLRLLGVLVAGATPILGWLGHYNSRVTGSPCVLPYSVWSEQYSQSSVWLVGELHRPKAHSSPMMAAFHRWEREFALDRRGLHGSLRATRAKVADVLNAFVITFPPVWPVVPLLALMAYRSRLVRWAALSLFLFSLPVLMELFIYPHYVAPAMALAALALTSSFATAIRSRRLRRATAGIATAAACLFVIALPISNLACGVPQREAARRPEMGQRARIARELASLAGRHLVFVRYSPRHSIHREWVYNDADLEATKVLWVRELEVVENRRLAAQLDDRQAWLVRADARRPRLIPFRGRARRRANRGKGVGAGGPAPRPERPKAVGAGEGS